MSSIKSVGFNILLAPAERRALRLFALKRGVPAAELVRDAIAQHIRPVRSPRRRGRA